MIPTLDALPKLWYLAFWLGYALIPVGLLWRAVHHLKAIRACLEGGSSRG